MQPSTTIVIPDDLYRPVKARTEEEGRRIREVPADLFQEQSWQGDPESYALAR